MDMPVVRFRSQPTQVHRVSESWPCCFCWGKRIAMTDLRDEEETPICADCASRSVRTLGMPRFVLETIQ